MSEVSMRATVKFSSRVTLRHVDRTERTYLGKAGAITRYRAQKSIRFTLDPDKASKPGTPPHTHDYTFRRSVLFGVDAAAGNVVVGPARSKLGDLGNLHEFGGKKRMRAMPFGPKTYSVGEFGPVSLGSSTVSRSQSVAGQFAGLTDPKDGSPVARLRLRTTRQAEHATRLHRRIALANSKMTTANYPARPYMHPALVSIAPDLPKIWADSIR